MYGNPENKIGAHVLAMNQTMLILQTYRAPVILCGHNFASHVALWISGVLSIGSEDIAEVLVENAIFRPYLHFCDCHPRPQETRKSYAVHHLFG